MNGSADVGLVFGRWEIESINHVTGFCDSDSDYVGVLTIGSPWPIIISLLQVVLQVSLLTIDFEYMAAKEAVKEVLWLKGFIGDIGVIQ